tara:strand:- start:325 stop:750 length:426 start_codon:yes stop_codon:yes gene_type:complete
MNKTIKKLDNGDFQVEDTTVSGIRRMLRPKHDYWDKPIKRNRKEQLTPEELEYRHERNRMNQMEGWPTVEAPDPDIAILDDIILGAHKRIALYEMLQNGMWYATFRCDSTDEVLRERELIREFEQMKQEVIEWKKRQKTTP